MRVVITGGAGFVGSGIARAFLASGAHVRIVDDLSTGKLENLPDRIDWHASDCGGTDYEQADAVVHCAAYPDVSQNWVHSRERTRQWEANADLTRRVLDRIPSGVPFVLLSTCSVYGPGTVTETSPVIATSPYAASKIAAEALVSAYHHARRIEGKILRLVNVVGPRYGHGHLADFVQGAAKGRIHALDDGRKRKSFVHVEDVGDAVIACLNSGRRAAAFAPFIANVASEVLWSWRDSVEVMRTMRPGREFTVTSEDRPSGWVGDPEELKVSSHWLEPGKASIVRGVREALEGLSW